MNRVKNLTGRKFNRLTIKSFSHMSGTHSFWDCLCDCGNSKIIRGTSITNGQAKSCGCLRAELKAKYLKENRPALKHGMSATPTYQTWSNMKKRCYNVACKDFPQYGGRGIKVCKRWRDSFQAFFYDMGERPKGLTLDRINNNGDYAPENCRWATTREQSLNTSRNVCVTIGSKTHTITQWCEILGLDKGVIFSRHHRGWSPYKALTTPIVKR